MTPAQEAIALLINLAQQGEIDPWDVQVIEVIDRYLSELGINNGSVPDYQNTDLPQSGQTFLWASMLVLLKADTLQRLEENNPEDESEFLDEDLAAQEKHRRLPLHLENHIRRRPTAPPPRQRRVTLQELIAQIEALAASLEENGTGKVNKRPRAYSRSEAKRLVTQLAHNENLTEIAAQLEQFLALNIPQLAPEDDDIDWENLLDWWTSSTFFPNNHSDDFSNHQEKHPQHDRVGIFWALLLLSAQSKVELFQEEFYQDLRIRPLNQDNLPELTH